MTWIRVEPDEMATVAGALQRTADDLSGVRTGARHDCRSCLPSDAEVIAEVALGLVDQILAAVSTGLVLQAVDLLARATTATTDSLTAASSATGPGVSPAPTVGVVGGNPYGSMSITPGTLLGGSVVGGTSSGWSIDPAAYGGGSVVGGSSGFVGGGTAGLLGGSHVGGRTAASADLDAFATRSRGPFLPPTFAQDALSHHNTVNLQPSRGNLMTDSGVYISPTEYTERGYRGLNE